MLKPDFFCVVISRFSAISITLLKNIVRGDFVKQMILSFLIMIYG
jgi:hypothetical protein